MTNPEDIPSIGRATDEYVKAKDIWTKHADEARAAAGSAQTAALSAAATRDIAADSKKAMLAAHKTLTKSLAEYA